MWGHSMHFQNIFKCQKNTKRIILDANPRHQVAAAFHYVTIYDYN